jgi:DNA sulfur modification protein DndB
MKKTSKISYEALLLPGLRAHMGDWVYYITFMRMEDIAARVNFAEEIHKSQALKELLQRKVTNRRKQIGGYLLSQSQRFFNALVVAAYDGEPHWYELEIGENKAYGLTPLPDYLDGAVGILHLNGKEKLFAIDGQHRVAGIREALQTLGQELNDEEICVIFLSHKNTPDGKERTRRLFTTLNRYAKPVSTMEIIALDEDDIVAIITRLFLEDYPLFADERIAVVKGKAIPASNNSCLTTVVTLYQVLDIILLGGKTSLSIISGGKTGRSIGKLWRDYKARRPEDHEIDTFYKEALTFWDRLVNAFPPLQEVRDKSPGVAGKYRNRDGGHLLFRPVGLLAYAKAVQAAMGAGMGMPDAVKRTSKIPIILADFPWVGLLWDNLGKKMITAKDNQEVASQLIYFMIGGNLSYLKTNESALRKDFAAALNKPEDEVSLPRQVHQ